jgi:3'-phosphoadenosine 5'-phosphosulfate sulfotransferase (PAPS reductase)/FAD synthetase
MSKLRIREWYRHHHGRVYVAFSGGKDSTVLLDLVRSEYPDVPAVFADTGLEYPEIRQFVKTIPNVTWVKPKMNFKKVIEKYGYPVVSKEQARYIRDVKGGTTEYMRNLRMNGKRFSNGFVSGKISEKWKYLIDAPFKISEQCCDVMKKNPVRGYEKEAKRFVFIGVMARDSRVRGGSYIKYGCNAFNLKQPQSRPIMFWTEDDIWEYIRINNIPYSKIYDMGESRTGCMWCAFGSHMEKGENRFQRMAKSHPKQYKFCMETLGMAKILDYIKVPYRPIPEQKALNLEVVE